jgi:hypothetical protein
MLALIYNVDIVISLLSQVNSNRPPKFSTQMSNLILLVQY